jgi:hypothetical protein
MFSLALLKSWLASNSPLAIFLQFFSLQQSFPFPKPQNQKQKAQAKAQSKKPQNKSFVSSFSESFVPSGK